MKKVFLAIITINIMWLIMPIVARADDSTEIIQNIESYYESEFGQSYSMNYSTTWNAFYTYWQNNPNYKCCIYDYAPSSNHSLYFNLGPDNYVLHVPYTKNNWREGDMCSTYVTSGSGNYAMPVNGDNWRFYNSFSEWQESMENIDYETVKYNPNYPYPWVKAYGERTPMDFNTNWVSYKWVFDGITYDQNTADVYAFIAVRFWAPNRVKVNFENGRPTYEILNWTSSPNYAIWDFDDRHVIYSGDGEWEINGLPPDPSLPVYTNQIGPYWDDFKDTITVSFVPGDGVDSSNNAYQDACDQYLQYDNEMGSMGNRMQLKACYYTLYQGYVESGLFTVWDSVQPQKFGLEQIGKMANLVGKEASSNTYQEDVSNAVDGMEEETQPVPLDNPTNGINVNVNMNYQVPNNMNYPTIVSYNHDNVFTTFLGTYNSATQYLDGFAAFCNATLLWIPAEIWSIVGLGFAMALIIMIVKIL